MILRSNLKFKQSSFIRVCSEPSLRNGFDSFNLFPLLPIEIRLLIWIMTFPEGRCIEPWTWDWLGHPSFLWLFPHHRPSHSGPGFNLAKTDPVALWVNRESREEVFKHYATRERAHLQHLERRYNVRWPAHIDFSKDTFSFGWNCTGRSIRPCDFLTKTDMDSIAHLELNSLFDVHVSNAQFSSQSAPLPLFESPRHLR